MFRLRSLALCALAAVLAFTVTDADVRAGRGGSFGSRGSQTFSAPPTATSPGARPDAADRHRRDHRLSLVDVVATPQPAGSRQPPGNASGASRPQTGFGGGSGAPASSARASGTDEVGLTPDDFGRQKKSVGHPDRTMLANRWTLVV
jgi:hypothetical protein